MLCRPCLQGRHGISACEFGIDGQGQGESVAVVLLKLYGVESARHAQDRAHVAGENAVTTGRLGAEDSVPYIEFLAAGQDD